MYEFVILAAIVGIIVGLLIGATLQKRLGASETLNRELRKTLDKEVENRQQYQQSVASHFSGTAKLLNELTYKYKDIHEHLALGAQTLCQNEDGQSLLADAAMRISIEQHQAEQHNVNVTDSIQPPLDYAPKKAPDDSTLAEEYGLEKVNLHQDSASTEDGTYSDPLFAGHSATLDDDTLLNDDDTYRKDRPG